MTTLNDCDELRDRVRHLERRRQLPSAVALFGAGLVGALIAAPLAAWSLEPVPSPPQEAQVISAAAMNANFAHVVEAITALEDRAFELSAPSGVVSTDGLDCQGAAGCPIDELSVTVTTTGRPVEIRLVQGTAMPVSRVSILEPGSGSSGLQVFFSRMPEDDVNPTRVASMGYYGNLGAVQVGLPSSAFAAVDTPDAGTWTYSVAVQTNDADQYIIVDNTRLMVREL